MQWYGSPHKDINIRPITKNARTRVRLKARTLALDFRPKTSYKDFTTAIFFPATCKYTYLRPLHHPNNILITLVYSIYVSILAFSLTQVKFIHDPYSRSVLLYFPQPNNFFRMYWLAFSFVFHIATQTFFHKLRFKGKGYYVYKNYRNVLAFQFGYAHRVKIYVPFVNVKLLSKTSVLLFGADMKDIMKASHWFFDKRPINVFTGRGVRFSRQIVYRKAGKVSSYR